MDGPTPNHIGAALSGCSGLKRNEKLGRELRGKEWAWVRTKHVVFMCEILK